MTVEELDAALVEGQREVERCEQEIKTLRKVLAAVEGAKTQEIAEVSIKKKNRRSPPSRLA